jgi:hypothetical protein
MPMDPPTLHLGVIDKAYHTKKIYYVTMLGLGVQQVCHPCDLGVYNPYKEGDQVLCSHHNLFGWIIVCRVPLAQAPIENGAEKTVLELLAEEQEQFQDYALGKSDTENLPNYGDPNEEFTPVHGDVIMKSRETETQVRTFSDGSLIHFVSNILYAAFLAAKNALVFTARQITVNIVPGFIFKVFTEKQDDTSKIDDSPTPQDKAPVRLEASLSSDSDKPTDRDFAVEAGGLRDADDLKFGRSKKTLNQTIKRGARIQLRKFGTLEVDNELNEVRLTVSKDGSNAASNLYQLRFNEDEAVISWGKDQFISLNSEGLFIKAKTIGFGGPWVMWDPAKVATFTHDKTPSPLDPLCEWYQGSMGAGIRFKKSVYFGSKGELAVLKSFVDEVYKSDVQALMTHVHGYVPPASTVTLVSPDLIGSLAGSLGKMGLPDYYSDVMV